MKVLITSEYDSPNSYFSMLADILREQTEFASEPQNFWTSSVDYDVVHIQWPEELFKWRKISEADLLRLNKRIAYLKNRGTKLVATLHNKAPHRKGDLDEKLYNIVYKHVDAVVHLGSYSQSFYPNVMNVVIPHPNYNPVIKVNPEDEKQKECITYLSFGKIRSVEEERQLIEAFLLMKDADTKLIIVNSLVGVNKYRIRQAIKKIKYRLYLRSLKRKNIVLITHRLSDDEINHYFNESDVVIVPRVDSLNSGVVFMGFSFGKVVVGPRIGNIKEYLDINSNPTFEPLNIFSIEKALRKAKERRDIGALNKKYSDAILDINSIAKSHLTLYKELLTYR
ncbi:glycosyltransferase family protein [Sphingobacterium wenxiniae]|nr:hypothetical protein [Sphingobacterium wenxiniae]